MRWPPSPLVRIALAVAVFLIVSLFGALVPIAASYIAGIELPGEMRAFAVLLSLCAGFMLATLVGVG